MPKALYRKYRSKTLNEVIGQDHVTDILRRALATETYGHAYLFTGPRGTGKTSIARILAHEINKLPYDGEVTHLDIIEIDAASNNGVDDVRELREKALVAPTHAPKKVYIIDEVHMLSKSAFNALLKILEEPPAHVIFILATTDFDKLPATIVSRTQRYHFHTVKQDILTRHLESIARAEDIVIEQQALELIAQRGGGSVRDSITLLDQIRNTSTEEVTREDVERALGLATAVQITRLVEAMIARAPEAIIEQLKSIDDSGISAVTLASQLIDETTRRLDSHPSLVRYLEGLHEVNRASNPMVKIIVSLVRPEDTPQPTAVQPPPSGNTSVKTPPPKPSVEPAPVKTHAAPSKAAATAESKQNLPTVDIGEFDWQKILEYAVQHKPEFIGVHTMLSKCTPEVHNDKIILYSGSKFAKSKLDTAKNRAIIAKIMRETGVGDVYIETVGTPPPPKDEQAAKIAAMMGGGEEVDVS